MLVGKRMTLNPVTVNEKVSIDDALHLMRERRIRRLPVVNDAGKLVGIVSDHDLLHAEPSSATSLSVYELHYLLARLTIKSVMTTPVITVHPDTPVEEAARIMVDSKIGGLPVVDGEEMVGIITETDIFKVLLDGLGARTPGVRFTLAAHEGKGILAELTHAIASSGANIVSLLTSAGEAPGERTITIKVNDVDPQIIRQAVESMGLRIVDQRTA